MSQGQTIKNNKDLKKVIVFNEQQNQLIKKIKNDIKKSEKVEVSK